MRRKLLLLAMGALWVPAVPPVQGRGRAVRGCSAAVMLFNSMPGCVWTSWRQEQGRRDPQPLNTKALPSSGPL